MKQAPEQIIIKVTPSGGLGEWSEDIQEECMFGKVVYFRHDHDLLSYQQIAKLRHELGFEKVKLEDFANAVIEKINNLKQQL